MTRSVTISVAQKIDAPAERAKALIADPNWDRWLPFIAEASCEGTEAGSKRSCTLTMPGSDMDGYVLDETIREVDAEAGRLAYSISNPPMPLNDFEAVVETQETDAGTTIVWTASFQAEENNIEMLRGAIIGQYQTGIAALEAHAKG